ncbi:MAG: glycosyltransferase family 2 protein [Ardenticatenaceae bacterium]|nr:glycosyltransferase family 2 protein [Ardenticatenaceae bacterium]
MTSDTIIIIPAYNEAANLPRVIPEIRHAVPDVDIVVVNDCSRDRTAQVAQALGAAVVSLPNNLGYGGAVQTGFRYAVEKGYAYGVMMDGDGQMDPHSVPALLDVVRSGRADLALGSRFLGRMEYKNSRIREFGQLFFRWVVRILIKQPITDPTCGFQALAAEAMAFFSCDNYPSDFPDADTLLLFRYAGFTVEEVPVTIRGRLSGSSMHAGWKPIYYVIKMLFAIFIVFLRHKTRVASLRQPPMATEGIEPAIKAF